MTTPKAAPLFLLLLVVVLFWLHITTGSTHIPLNAVLSALSGETSGSLWSDIVWQFRLPRAITCILAGSALAGGGLMMQTLFRNPLAGPDVLGLSSGASLAVAVVILAGTTGSTWLLQLSTNPWSIALAASLGSALVFLLIIAVARRITSNVSMLIIGLMISAVTSSMVSLLQFLSKSEDLQAFLIWSMGSVGGTGWTEIKVLTLVVAVGMTISGLSLKPLNALLLGENYAVSLGIRLKQARFWIVLSTSLMAGGVTAFCGPIAFVGLAVPHLVRLLSPTSNHKVLMPSVALGGAALILLCDLISQWPGDTHVLPLNAITSLIGAPVVIWVVLRQRRKIIS